MTTPILFKEYIWLVNTIYQARNITLEEINRKWVQTDMSGGVEIARNTFIRHRNAIENIFGIPGIGRLLISSVTSRDFPLTQTLVVYIALLIVVVNFAVDLVIQAIDPRISLYG